MRGIRGASSLGPRLILPAIALRPAAFIVIGIVNAPWPRLPLAGLPNQPKPEHACDCGGDEERRRKASSLPAPDRAPRPKARPGRPHPPLPHVASPPES